MIPTTQQHYMLPESVPTALVYVLAVVAIVVWILLHRVWRRPRGIPLRIVRFAALAGVGFVALSAVWQAMLRGFELATDWPLWPLAILGALAVEIVIALYVLERRTVSRRAGLGLAGLRVVIVVLVVVMMAQPVFTWNLDKTIQRWVAVLLDTSASMYVPDTQLGASEKLRLAESLSIEGARRPFALDVVAETMEKVRQDIAAEGEWLASLGTVEAEARKRQLGARRADVNQVFAKADEVLAEQADALAAPLKASLGLDDSVTRGLDDVRKRLASPLGERLKELLALTDAGNTANLEGQLDRLLKTVREATAELGALGSKTDALATAIDEAVYESLPGEVRARVDTMAQKKRLALAHDVLLHSPPAQAANAAETDDAKSLLQRLQDKYGVKMYTFASAPAEVDLKAFGQAYASGDEVPGDAATLPAEQQQTDLTNVFEKVMAEMSDTRLSGILVLSDGRHNAAKSVEPLVRQLGIRGVPVSSVVFGGEKPPIDAGIISVQAPETMATGDKVFITAQLKLDGLAGKEVLVSLNDGDKTVDTQTVRIPTDTYRVRVQLSDEPKEVGLHRYAIQLPKFDDEVLTTNNQYPLAVSVSDERARLLLVEGRPRWEFRYIKNLFTSRDRTVRLQYVLLEPDRIEGVPTPPKVNASASRPVDEVEATALPKDETEWMKFDVIVLGDVSPQQLGDEQQRILRKFVTERGGTLVVIAGPTSMPHAFADTAFADVLPVRFGKSAKAFVQAPEKEFRLLLTADGRESVIMRQQVNPEENLKIWNELPPVYWRYPILGAKEGATVLAYALPPSAPDYMPKPGAEAAPADQVPSEDVLRQRRAFERQHALIALHNVATGKVMFLAFDHTWRLRYRAGDTYHHRFWGQVLRWATANKLPAGTETVKLGTDRTRYAPHGSVRVQAKIAKKDFTPIVDRQDVAVNVFAGDKSVLRQNLRYVPNSAGMYEADLGELPSGTYRVELDAPVAKPMLDADNVKAVSLEFSVDLATPAEQAELSPDRGLLSRLATLTGGKVAAPSRADRVLEALGPVTEVQIERQEYPIWDSVPLLVLIILTASAEWLLRKKVGLA